MTGTREQATYRCIHPDHLLSKTAIHLKLRFNEDLNMPRALKIGAAIDAAQRGWDCPTVIVTLDAKRRLSVRNFRRINAG